MSLVPYVHVDASLDDAAVGDEVTLSATERHHLGTVLRLRPGASVEVADGRGTTADGRLTEHGVRLATVPVRTPPATPRLVVVQAIGKGRKLDEVVRVATELGVDEILPVTAARSVTRLESAKIPRALERWRSIARSAAEQARRPTIPTVARPVSASDLVAATRRRVTSGDEVLVAHLGGTPLPAVLTDVVTASEVWVAVGPEGGWTDEEVGDLEAVGARRVGLGPTVLRTEHAAAAALAVLGAASRRWG